MTTDSTLRVARDEPRVDVGALAAGLQLQAANLVASTLVHAIGALSDNENPLAELQQVALIESALRHFDGYELAVAQDLKRDLEDSGVTVWGLTDEHERLLGTDAQSP
jgi:hypothetical protein